MMFIGQEFCPHCGAKADRKDSAALAAPELCPRCRVEMNAVVVGASNLRECPRCEGIWTDTATLRQICADREKQAAVLGMAPPAPPQTIVETADQIHYLPCPVCKELMNRVNFASFSGVIVEVCRQHGTWFDRDELRRIVEFIRAGGMDQARAREIANLAEDRRLAATDRMFSRQDNSSGLDYGDCHMGVSAVADFLIGLLK
jgi:Zn-finger nucleic acid-binding protein